MRLSVEVDERWMFWLHKDLALASASSDVSNKENDDGVRFWIENCMAHIFVCSVIKRCK